MTFMISTREHANPFEYDRHMKGGGSARAARHAAWDLPGVLTMKARYGSTTIEGRGVCDHCLIALLFRKLDRITEAGRTYQLVRLLRQV